jgi:hypothetical protein
MGSMHLMKSSVANLQNLTKAGLAILAHILVPADVDKPIDLKNCFGNNNHLRTDWGQSMCAIEEPMYCPL